MQPSDVQQLINSIEIGVACVQFKIEPFKHPLKMDPHYGGELRPSCCYA